MAKFAEPTWLYHPEQGPRLFAPGDEAPPEPWQDEPFDRQPEADPRDNALQAARIRIHDLEAEVADLTAKLNVRKQDPTE